MRQVKKGILIFLIAMVLALVLFYFWKPFYSPPHFVILSSPNDSSPQLARIFSRIIYLKDVDLNYSKPCDNRTYFSSDYAHISLEDCYQLEREATLNNNITYALRQDFGKTHDIYGNATEIAQLYSFLNRTLPPIPPQFSGKIPDYYEQAKFEIEYWKFNKAIYTKYGGKVFYDAAEGFVPYEGYYHFLSEHAQKGDFEILNVTYNASFWERTTPQFWENASLNPADTGILLVPADQVNFSLPPLLYFFNHYLNKTIT